MSLKDRIMENTLVYRLWQAPFAEDKLAPILSNNDLAAVHRILDVGCGPGTNTRHFTKADYLGIDLNEKYIRYARRRYRRPFMVADVTTLELTSDERFDFIILNSLLHHLDDEQTRKLLNAIAGLLSPDGHIHILELILPTQPSIARLLARLDRGRYARPLEQWQALFANVFDPVLVQTYSLGMLGIPLWNMVYFKGRAK